MVRRRGQRPESQAALTAETDLKVRFSEVDSMKIVWHGNYVHYFEDGREAFGKKYDGIGYLDMYANGFTAPIVDMRLQYLRPLSVGETAVIETRYIDSPAAKLCFEYIIRRSSDGEIAVKGSTMQVFLDSNGELCLTLPPFVEEWKKKWLK